MNDTTTTELDAEAARLTWLFRHARPGADPHPLLPVLKRHRGVESGPPTATSERPLLGPASACALIDDSQLRQRIGALPSLPRAVLDAMDLLRKDDASSADLAQCIERDQALTARTLRVANSAFYGAPGRVGTIRNAIDVLGRRAVGSLVTSTAVAAQFDAKVCPEFDFAAFWKHAMACAMAARGLARAVGIDEESAFTAALLHDIGRLALASAFPDALTLALQRARSADIDLLSAEREVLGTDHALVGMLVASHWRFPPAVVEAIQHHHAPTTVSDTGVSLSDIVHLADALAHGLDPSAAADEAVPMIEIDAWTRAKLPTEQVLAILAGTAADLDDLCKALLS